MRPQKASAKGTTLFEDENVDYAEFEAKYFGAGNNSETTGISEVTEVNSGNQKAAEWFTLGGARLPEKPTTPGIYICNGKKIAI